MGRGRVSWVSGYLEHWFCKTCPSPLDSRKKGAPVKVTDYVVDHNEDGDLILRHKVCGGKLEPMIYNSTRFTVFKNTVLHMERLSQSLEELLKV